MSLRFQALVTLGSLFVASHSCGESCGGQGSGSSSSPRTTEAVSDAHVEAPPAVGKESVPADAGDAPKRGAAAMPSDLNVLVVSIDSLRADMPWAGYERPIAPRLTELEKRAVSYTRAYAVSSYTSMSLGGFLGGKLPSSLKRSGYFFGTYPEANLFFPEVLQKNGIRTLSAHAHTYFANAGFKQGFDEYEIVPGITFNPQTDENVTGPKHEAIAEKLLSDPALESKRFFAWFHFLDPHDQYQSHEKDGIPPYGNKLRDRYDGEVTFTDQWVGKLLDFVASKPWGKRTVILVTADHGEAFGEHGGYRHGFEIWEHLVHVPLFVVAPGAEPRRIDEPRSGIDLAPTILEFLGVPPEGAFEGKSLVGEIYGDKPEPRDVLVDLPMTSNNDKRRALIHGKWKMIGFGKAEALQLFDLEADPKEEQPIRKGDDFDQMAARYRAASKGVEEIPAYGCRDECLNGGGVKRKKDIGD